MSSLYFAAANDHIDVAEWLLKRGCNVNETLRGSTVLHFAIMESKVEMVRFLLERGADPNAQNSQGMTILSTASGADARVVTDFARAREDYPHEINEFLKGKVLQYGRASLLTGPSKNFKGVERRNAVEFEQKCLEAAIAVKLYCPVKKCSALMDLEDDPRNYENAPQECPGYTCEQFQELPADERCQEDLQLHRLIEDRNWTRSNRFFSEIYGSPGCSCDLFDVPPEIREDPNARLHDRAPLRAVAQPIAVHEEYSDSDDEDIPYNPQFAAHQQQPPPQHPRAAELQPLIGLRRRVRKNLPYWLKECLHFNKCHYCNRSFASVDELDIHQSHTNEHPVHHCCGRTFAAEFDKWQHESRH
ncbi:hypothetical protein DFJ73DRAFT_923024 [Zopfochytrium polystomum]|nr:hypothetical protein DFJ73DRAFT_923024 [Zopfochytrium polystomum]